EPRACAIIRFFLLSMARPPQYRLKLKAPMKTNVIRTLLFTLIVAFALLGNALNAGAAEDSYVFTPISACPSCSTLPVGINDTGLISGLYFGAHGHLHGFLVRNGNFLRFDVPGALFTEAGRSNDLGQIAGDYLAADGIDRPFV